MTKIVVDIGNSRMKWGRVADGRVASMVSLPLDDPSSWEWALSKDAQNTHWTVASVNPPATERFTKWVQTIPGTQINVVNHYSQIPLTLAVDQPESVGIDRLLNALTAHRLVKPSPAIVVSLGTAITVDLVDETGTFHGGAIGPGARLMAKSLHDYTAKLPLIDNPGLLNAVCPGKNTDAAIRLGIACAAIGMLHGVCSTLASQCRGLPAFVFTGGDLDLLTDPQGRRWSLDPDRSHYVPTLTLDGIAAVTFG